MVLTLIAVIFLVACGVVFYDFWYRFGQRFDGIACLEPLKGQVFLTYDDGPASGISGWSDRASGAFVNREAIQALDPAWDFDASPTENLARVLAEFGVRAIFFVRGDVLDSDPAARNIVSRLREKGHVLGNHSFSHQRYHDLSPEECLNEIERTHLMLQSVTGESAVVFRPPYGLWHIGRSLRMWSRPGLRHYGLPVGWTHCTFDWEKTAEDLALPKIKEDVEKLISSISAGKAGVVLLQHDVWIYTVLFTRILLERVLQEKGLQVGDPQVLVWHVNRISGLAKRFFGLGFYFRARLVLIRARFAGMRTGTR